MSTLLLISYIRARLAFDAWLSRRAARGARTGADGERGQATTEYALVLLAAASIALVLVAWATKGGKLIRLFDSVIDQVIGKAS
jgi:Flp pilus assembly pilin Flp